jgi:hypothetical protein
MHRPVQGQRPVVISGVDVDTPVQQRVEPGQVLPGNGIDKAAVLLRQQRCRQRQKQGRKEG